MSFTPATRSEPFSRDEGWRDVLVIGGGASGVLFAANLLRQDTDLRVTVVEGRHLLGCGIAYSTSDPDHLLNTRVHNMSAFPDEADHFLHWLEENAAGSHDSESFVGRATYGSYLSCLLAPWTASGRLVCIKADCLGISEREGGVKAELDDGRQLKGAYAVLATGHVVPKEDPSGLISGAWSVSAPPDDGAPVLIIGTGLSMVDQVLSLERAGHQGQIIAISRRGLLPRSHGPGAALKVAAADVPLGAPVSHLLAWLRGLVREAGAGGGTWRSAVDGIRPYVSLIWQNMTIDQRKRFLRHAATWWEVHRHRIPPASAARLEAAMAAGRLRIERAAFIRAEPAAGETVTAVIQPRGAALPSSVTVGRIIDCRGIRNDPEKNASPLMAGLLAEGAARVDPLRIGFEVSPEARLIGQNGAASERLFTLGPVSRAMFWEITAIPDIRVQAGQMARYIAAREGAAAG
ncbi:FAD/NAD(P)-binding protein [Pseudogemmobacter bohemicus]|uniref:FAD/NAD(P)-binding protein n=1 Tax=Pseudogemmobacter bohemicus TaxID=2250708 RepID=UPI000DD3862F|nr:FAD/NAD(P)-binding protein [Pseudogemmobacter bohemicus]